MWVCWDNIWSRMQHFLPVPSCFAHWFHSLVPWGLYLPPQAAILTIGPQAFDLSEAETLVSSDLCFTQSLCSLIGSRYTLSQASEEPIKDTVHHISSPRSKTSACQFLGRWQREGCHLHFMGHSKKLPSLQLLMGVRRRKRTLQRYYMLWHFKGDYFFFPSIMGKQFF